MVRSEPVAERPRPADAVEREGLDLIRKGLERQSAAHGLRPLVAGHGLAAAVEGFESYAGGLEGVDVAAQLPRVVQQTRPLSLGRYLTAAHAAAFCDMSVSGFRNAVRRGKVTPGSRRGGDGDLTWAVEDLERFMEPKKGAERASVDKANELLGLSDSRAAGGVVAQGRWRSRPRPHEGPTQRQARRNQATPPERHAQGGARLARIGAPEDTARTDRPGSLADSLSRIRSAASGEKNRER
jgi:hypothetical protein